MATSLKLAGAAVTYAINELNTVSQQIPVPATTAGNILLAFVASSEFYAANHVNSIADSATNTWAQVGSTQSSGSGAHHVATQIFMASGSTVSATWIKLTSNADVSTCDVTFVELFGALSSPTDVSNGGTATATTTVTATNTPTTLGDVVFLFGATGDQSLSHTKDGTAEIAMVGAPYSAGTAGAGAISSLVLFIGAPSAAVTTTWTAAASTNFAWSSISLKATAPGTGGLRQVNSGDPVSAADVNQFTNLLNGNTTTVPLQVSNRIQASFAGATARSGFVGGTTSGSPVTGTFMVGDFVVDQTGSVWICVTAGTPGSWARCGINNYLARSYQASFQNYTGSSSFQTVTTDTSSFDPRSMWTPASNGFTIPFSGARWRVVAGQHVSVSGSGRFAVAITKNGTEICRGYDGPTSSGKAGGCVSDIQAFNSGDIIRAAILSTATGNTAGGTALNYLAIALADG